MQLISMLQERFNLAADAAQLILAGVGRRDQLWADCRNSMGIARLLVHEGRPEALVATVCRLAVESACRAALEHLQVPYDGDLPRALRRLSVAAEAEPVEGTAAARARQRLDAAEELVGGIAAVLREADPARSWTF